MEIINLIRLNDFSDEAIKTFENLFYNQDVLKEDIEKNDNCYVLRVGINGAFDADLMLENASGLPDKYVLLSFDEKIEKQGIEYVLFGSAYNDYDFTNKIPFEIRFTDAKVKTKVYKASSEGVISCPWFNLCYIAFEIVDKYLFSKELLNEAEMKNLPLILELANLLSYSDYKNEVRLNEYPILKQHILKHGLNKALKRLENIESESNPEKLSKLKEQFLEKLDSNKYEPLFRELFEIVLNTQNAYKTRIECRYPSDKLVETRKQIDSLIKAKGYEGEYPLYFKQGNVKRIKIRAANYYPKKYFVFANKKIINYVYCMEKDFENDSSLFIDFCCGCEAIKGDDQKSDLISFMFNSNGKPFYDNVNYSQDYYDEEGELISDNLERKINIACKIAELKKLSKSERKENASSLDFKFDFASISITIALSLLIALIILSLFMLFGVLLCQLFGLSSEIPSMFTEIPWLKLYFISAGIIELVLLIYNFFS